MRRSLKAGCRYSQHSISISFQLVHFHYECLCAARVSDGRVSARVSLGRPRLEAARCRRHTLVPTYTRKQITIFMIKLLSFWLPPVLYIIISEHKHTPLNLIRSVGLCSMCALCVLAGLACPFVRSCIWQVLVERKESSKRENERKKRVALLLFDLELHAFAYCPFVFLSAFCIRPCTVFTFAFSISGRL